ncbi:MAG: DUF58 domain-containing protein [Acidimicrobiales bacterium]|nr:DUF58 domain-containing protein [Acidimicrobiales bacterium]
MVLRELRDPQLLGALERLQLGTRRRLAGQLVGGHRSPRYGSSLDFADFREYQPGDDFRRIDYLTLARLDQLLVRLYDAEDDLTVRLVIDTSASMGMDGKLQRAAEMAGALGFVALTRRDRVQVHVPGKPAARFNGRNAVGALFDHLESLTAGGVGSLSATAIEVLGRQRGAGMTVLCSDLLESDWDVALSRFPARGAEVTVVHVLGAGELDPPELGDVDLVDSETGERVAMTMTAQSLEAYHERLNTWLEEVEFAARRAGAAYVRADVRVPLREALLGGLRQTEVVS